MTVVVKIQDLEPVDGDKLSGIASLALSLERIEPHLILAIVTAGYGEDSGLRGHIIQRCYLGICRVLPPGTDRCRTEDIASQTYRLCCLSRCCRAVAIDDKAIAAGLEREPKGIRQRRGKTIGAAGGINIDSGTAVEAQRVPG